MTNTKSADISCGHASGGGRYICEHLLGAKEPDYCIAFAGNEGKRYRLVCTDCRSKASIDDVNFIRVCPDCFRAIEDGGFWDWDEHGVWGIPSSELADLNLAFEHSRVKLDVGKIEAVAPSRYDHRWLVLSDSGHLCWLSSSGEFECLPGMPSLAHGLEKGACLHVSSNDRYAAVTQANGQYGMVWELETGDHVLDLDRKDYRFEHTEFPLVFISRNGTDYVVHGTDWNRLDVTNLNSGELVTARQTEGLDREDERNLDYFHGRLLASPDGSKICDDGWVWHPVGVPMLWSFDDWLANPWECENGKSLQHLWGRAYYWEGPMCWINDGQIMVYGYGNDDLNLIPAALTFEGEELVDWFPGPEGEFYPGKRYLYASSHEKGTGVWDIDLGTRVHFDPSLKANSYHPLTETLLTVDGKTLQFSRLVEA